MEIIKLEEIQPKEIAQALAGGKTIIYPTETCYGLGCDATNQEAVDKLFAIKQRQQEKSMLVVVPDITMARRFVVWNPALDHIANTYWPGPLTVVAKAKEETGLAQGVLSKDGTLAFRVTSDPCAQELSSRLGEPLVSTSANLASEASPYDMESVLSMFLGKEHQPDIVIDAGALPHRNASTIIRVKDGRVEILRQGELVVDPTKILL